MPLQKIRSIISHIRHHKKKKEYHINKALKAINGKTYLEIGVRDGMCFKQIKAEHKTGVDPDRQEFGELAQGEQFFEITSDAFFNNHADTQYDTRKLDVAFVDGLHEFEQATRDIFNAAKYIKDNGVIFIHDCNPPIRRVTEIQDGGAWYGDVWKAAYYITQRRPELTLFVLDCDYGLGVLSGFGNKGARTMPDEKAFKESKELDYSALENDRENVLNLKPISYSEKFFAALK